MTRAERWKLAKAARELASDFAEGRGPPLNPSNWCGCAAGQIFSRAKVLNNTDCDDFATPAENLDGRLNGILTEATDRELGCHGFRTEARLPGAVVFPFLWAADELESAP
jgi:hypothetical protein